MLTDTDIEKLKAVFATKEDLASMEERMDKKYVTKRDLQNLATKEDLKQFATNAQLENVTSELVDYINASAEGVKIELRKEMGEMRKEFKEELMKLNKRLDKRFDQLIDTKTIVYQHEIRLDKLENKEKVN